MGGLAVQDGEIFHCSTRIHCITTLHVCQLQVCNIPHAAIVMQSLKV